MRRTLWRKGFVAMLVVIEVWSSRAAANEQVRCDDVTSIDVKNMSIEFPARGKVQMNDGTGFSSDAGVDGESRDWKITLIQDVILRPTTSVILRLVRFNADHITGSGAWDHVFIYKCRNGNFVRLFEESHLYGTKIQRLADDEITFVSGEWVKGDPTCCPSKEKQSTYKWDTKSMRYILIEESIWPRTEGQN